ncbi:hypothetical protein JCM16303_003958 [Sporobolomyces ruberrimus]
MSYLPRDPVQDTSETDQAKYNEWVNIHNSLTEIARPRRTVRKLQTAISTIDMIIEPNWRKIPLDALTEIRVILGEVERRVSVGEHTAENILELLRIETEVWTRSKPTISSLLDKIWKKQGESGDYLTLDRQILDGILQECYNASEHNARMWKMRKDIKEDGELYEEWNDIDEARRNEIAKRLVKLEGEVGINKRWKVVSVFFPFFRLDGFSAGLRR